MSTECMENEYYDGTKLLSLMDINGRKPEIYFCTTNRSAGKTTYFSRLCVNKFKSDKSKFMILYRFDYELSDCAEKFFKDIQGLFFPKDNMTSKPGAENKYVNLYLNDVHCGYVCALNNADFYKKNSHYFSDVDRMFMDEFMSETNHYCNDEITKYKSIHTSVARGQGKQVRYVPVYMCANAVTLLNPYYEAMGISSRLSTRTKFLKGDGFVVEQGYVESVWRKQMDSGFNRAFMDKSYVDYGREGVYLNDSNAFIERPLGKSRYIATIKYENCEYAIREFYEAGVVYCDKNVDRTFPLKIAVTTDDHNINYVMLKGNNLLLDNMKYYFRQGCFRFKDLSCKQAVLKTLSY